MCNSKEVVVRSGVDHATCGGERCVYGFFKRESGVSAVRDCGEEARAGLRSVTIRGGGDAENGGNFSRGGGKVGLAGDNNNAGVTGGLI